MLSLMAVIVTMLRGVNVGGCNRIKMEALRDLYQALGLRGARTFIQSGNVICATRARHLAGLAGRIADAIEQSHGFRCDVLARTLPEMREVVARNPFAPRRDWEPAKLLVTFLEQEPGAEDRQRVLAMDISPEELRIDGRQVYAYFPNGLARTKLSWPLIAKYLRTPATGRNWNTVCKLLEIAEQMETAQ